MLTRPAEFDAEVLQFHRALRSFAQSLTGNAARADDLTQDTICKALAKHEQFEPGSNMKAWLFTIMRNEHYSAARKSGREVADVDGVFASLVPVNESQTWAYDLKVTKKRMRSMNRIQRQVVLLCGIEGQQMDHVAEMLSIPVGTVKSALSRGRAFLETGEEVDLDYDPAPPSINARVGDKVESLYRQGLSVAAIKAEVTGASRSDIMRIIVERKLRAPAR